MKKKSFKITIKPEDIKTRNLMHFEVQKTTRAQVVQSKKHKKEKHKKDYLRDNYD